MKPTKRKKVHQAHPVFEVVPTPWGVINCQTSVIITGGDAQVVLLGPGKSGELKMLSDLPRDYRLKGGDIILVGKESS